LQQQSSFIIIIIIIIIMSKLRVLIVGASIAGPTAAYWFAKAGADVTIIERFPHLRPGGQNIDIRSIGVTVMRKMAGMEAAVRANLVPIEGMSIVREDGTPYGTVRSTGNPDAQAIVSEYEILRGNLARILVDMTKDNPNIRYIFGEQVASISYKDHHDGPVHVDFANGLPAADFDLVVACDGSTSRTRAIGFECGVRDHIKPTNCFAAYTSSQHDLLEGDKVGHGFSAPGGRFLAIGPDPNPTGISRMTFMSIDRTGDNPTILAFRKAQALGEDALKTFVAEHFRDMGWRSNEAIEHMLKTDDFYASEIVQVKPPGLYKGRVVLVGDAGYGPGPTGTGTSLAIGGAYVLAGEVSEHKDDLAAGLRAYEDRMRPIIDDMQQLNPIVLSFMAPQTNLGIWLRNSIFAFICWLGVLDLIQKYMGSAFQSGEKHKLEDYSFEH
jgi:2-polyprenyl-6-methoxyphenol hydroxylase-like FAD-dependent oxidoreductase